MYGGSGGWTQDDFADVTDTAPREYDPWAVQSADEPRSSPIGSNIGTIVELGNQTSDVDPDLDLGDDQDADDAAISSWDKDLFEEDFGNDAFVEISTLREWDESNLNTTTVSQYDSRTDPNNDDSYLDEPLPFAEYDSELGQPLYEVYDDDPNLYRKITINEFLSGIDVLGHSQSEEITDLLLRLSTPRFRSWLPWMRQQQWTGHFLLLFLQFRDFWDQNSELWECLRWSSGLKFWFRFTNRNSLSLDNSYLLIQRRLNYSADEVIDIEWFEDWDRLDVWARVTHGFFSFSSFAIYRSQFLYAEDWRHRPDLQIDLDAPVQTPFSTTSKSDFPEHRRGIRLWFATQDWYDPVEWHDGLGW